MTPDRWRLGTRNPFTVYRVADGAHDVEHAREHFVTSFRTEEDARRAVDAVNAQADRVDLDYPAGRWRDVYVRVHGDKEVAATEQVTDTIRIDWSAPNAAGEVDIVGVEVVAATGVEVDGDPAGSAVGQRGAPTRDARGEAEAVAKAFGRLCGGDDGASWDDEEEIAVPREWVRRAYRLALAALRDGEADTGGKDDGPAAVSYAEHERVVMEQIAETDRATEAADQLAAALAPSVVVGEHSSSNDPWRNALDYAGGPWGSRNARYGPEDKDWRVCGAVFAVVAAAGAEMPAPLCELPRGHSGDHDWLKGRSYAVVEADPQTGEPLTTEHHRIAESVATHALDETRTRLSTALGVSLDPDDPDPVGRLVEAARKARGVEVVSGTEAAELPVGSIVVQCESDGTPFDYGDVCGVGQGFDDWLRVRAAVRVLYRAPAPAPAALTVGEVVDTAAKFATLPESARLVPCDEEGQPMVDMQVVTPQSYLGEWDAASDDAPFVILTLPAVRVGTSGGETGE